LKTCARAAESGYIISRNESKRRDVDDFQDLCEFEWSNEINSTALNTIKTAKMNKPQRLPLTEDLRKLNLALNADIAMFQNSLTEQVEAKNWQYLAEATLAKMILFNRKRSGEAERMLIESYKNRSKPSPITDIEEALSKSERIMCTILSRVEIRGKFGRTVPVILPKQLISAIDKLLETREAVKVNKSNQYVFARTFYQSTSCMRGHDCLRKYARSCKAEFPENLTSTQFTKACGYSVSNIRHGRE